MEPSGIDITMLGPPGTAERDERLVVASRLSTKLALAHSVEDVASIAVRRQRDAFANEVAELTLRVGKRLGVAGAGSQFDPEVGDGPDRRAWLS